MTGVYLYILLLLPQAVPSVETEQPGWAVVSREQLEQLPFKDWVNPNLPNWLYHPGDSAVWAEPGFDDSKWRTISTYLVRDSLEQLDWEGIGWFRMHLRVDSSLVNEPLSLRWIQVGASQVYLNGTLLVSMGRPGNTPKEEERCLTQTRLPIVFYLNGETDCVLAVRYSNQTRTTLNLGEPETGFIAEIGLANERVPKYLNTITWIRINQMFTTGAVVVVALIFLLIYVFSRRSREDLYFSLFAVGCAMICFWPFQVNMATTPATFEAAQVLFKLGLIITTIFGLRFLYAVIYDDLPVQFWIFVGIGLVAAILVKILPLPAVYLYTMAGLLELLRISLWALHQGHHGSRFVAIGCGMFTVGSVYQIAAEWRLFDDACFPYFFPYQGGTMLMIAFMSIYLAKRIAWTNLELSHKLDEVRHLSEKNIQQELRAKEQETRRQLLEKDLEHQRKELEDKKRLETALSELESANLELKQTQAQLIQSEKMASMGMLVAGVAHEINTPVGAIGSMHNTLTRAFSKLKDSLSSGAISDDSISRPLSMIDEANRVIETGCERVSTIVKRLRSFARLDEAEVKVADIHEGLEDTLTLIHHEIKHNIELIKDYGQIPQIACYPGQLNQVFLNLLMNARQAIKGKGTITIKTRTENNRVRIAISDTGSGIAPEHLARVFDPGFTTKGVGVGTGLGLAICYQIIQDHHGKITVESELGKGTTFTVTLPSNLDELQGHEDNKGPTQA